MTRTIAVVLAAALGAALSAPLPAAGNQKCTACGAVCPAGWTLCQKCKNETERAQREENRRRRLAEAEEAKRRKKAEQAEAKLRRLAEQPVQPPPAAQPAAQPAASAAQPAPQPAAQPAASAARAPLAGLFSVRFEDAVEPPRFMKRYAKVGDREEPYYVFTPVKPFRGFAEYTAKADPTTGKVMSISAHRRFTATQGLEAKHASFAEFETCLALLKRKFGLEAETVEDSLARRKCVMKFVSSEGVPTHLLVVTLARDMEAAAAALAAGNPEAVEQGIDLVYDLTITAIDRVAALREKMAAAREKAAREAADLEAL